VSQPLLHRTARAPRPLRPAPPLVPFFFFHHTAPTVIYPLSLHDALPICLGHRRLSIVDVASGHQPMTNAEDGSLHITYNGEIYRSEEHTSELQSLTNLVCRLLLEKKKNNLRRDLTFYHIR